jgi:oligopeptidase B
LLSGLVAIEFHVPAVVLRSKNKGNLFMKKIIQIAWALALMTGLAACNSGSGDTSMRMQDDFDPPPVAAVQAQTFKEHGDTRIDNYYWLKNKEDPKVLAYVEAENSYAKMVMAPTAQLQQTLFTEMKSRYKENDSSVPYFSNGYFYYSRTEAGKQNKIYCRKKGSLDAPEEVILDSNKLANEGGTFELMKFEATPDNRYLIYAYNTTGSFWEYVLRIRDLKTGEDLPETIDKLTNFQVSKDGGTIFYTVPNESQVTNKVFKRKIGGGAAQDALIFEEKDGEFYLALEKSASGDYIFLLSYTWDTSEYQILSADRPDGNFEVFYPRENGVYYGLDHHKEKFLMLWKDGVNPNKKILEAPLQGYSDRSSWKEVVPHNSNVLIENLVVFDKSLVYRIRENGVQQLRIRNIQNGMTRSVALPDAAYELGAGDNQDYNSTKFRYTYTSYIRPGSVYEYDVLTDKSELLRQVEVPGYNPDNYVLKVVTSTASDGVKVPMVLFYKKGLELNGNNPTLLFGYGAYAVNYPIQFSSMRLSLIDRGFIFAHAQVRGGSELGQQWANDGKLLKKKNTFTDFIACAEELIKSGYNSPRRLAINGGSAGGTLIGAVLNMRPDLFQVAVADVPYVDVLNTMMDSSIPLTVSDYPEFGNPAEDKEIYDYMRSYAPYENVGKKAYPHLLVTSGLNDSQVGFYEAAKWVAKLRSMKTDNNLLLLTTNMNAGHGLSTSPEENFKDYAFRYAFILDRLGMK